jgi:hypothetical protein
MSRTALLFALAGLVGCGSTSDAAEVAPAPTPQCSLEIHADGAWTRRAALPCPGDTVRLLVAGDVGLPTQTLAATLSGAQRYCAEFGCDLGLLPGDLLYGDGKLAPEFWPGIWDAGFARLGFPFAAVLGNHEYRHEPNPDRKRATVLASDGRAGLIAPGPSYALRLLGPDGAVRLAVAAVDTDSVSNPGPAMPGLGEAALEAACGTGAPVVWLGHHPPSSQGGHHGHEAHVETALRARLKTLVAGGCRVAVATAGPDHDLQAYGPGCQEDGVPGVVVSGPAARGFRDPGPAHLAPCPARAEAASSYHAGLRETGGFAWVALGLGEGSLEVRLVEALGDGAVKVLSTDTWSY